MLISVEGLPTIAHPRDLDNLAELLTTLKAAGPVGLAAYPSVYTS